MTILPQYFRSIICMAKGGKCFLSIGATTTCFKLHFISSSTRATIMETKSSYNESMYQEAVNQLNKLQSNIQVLNAARANREKTALASVPGTKKALLGIGVQLEDLDSLNIIHVAGSKGKGTTCAFIESILRHAGLRTGFFSSPHLIAARERIRINGQPLTQQQFAQYFFTTFNKLNSATENKSELPGYFRFLTCMAFHVFLEEKVDVAVVEVGIGGLYDSTNVIRKPTVVGITSLGLEHQSLLGNTLEEIAHHKAGIMKENVPAFTVHSQPPHILKLLNELSLAYKCPLEITPSFENYEENIKLGIDDGVVSRLNATLAIQLVNCFLRKKFPHKLESNFPRKNLFAPDNEVDRRLSSFHISGLQQVKWHGRFQIINVNENLSYYVDGAHTSDSLAAATDWFISKTTENSFRVLIFHLTGDRKAEDLLRPFATSDAFNLAIFCPLVISTPYSSKADNWSALSDDDNEIGRCTAHKNLWGNFTTKSTAIVCPNVDCTLKLLEKLSTGEVAKDKNGNQGVNITNDKFVHSIDDLNAFVKGKRVSVLITGSLHLVGTFLSLLDPELK